ncbi:MAG: ABC transporter permease [Plectolyngbya sp. WJT66-NPBG17]|nr:ABC transporter permease [Plectolyngbya sp. WJT66-NPBG17]
MRRNRPRSRPTRNLQAARSLPQVAVYHPDSQMLHPLRLVREMWRDLLMSRDLAWQLMRRDISAKYRQSVLGFLWAFLPALIMAVGFTAAKGSGVVNIGNTDLPYPAYIMFSMTLWQTFVEALNAPVQAVATAKSMLSRINFPREALILAKLGEIGFNFGIKFVFIVALFLWFRIPVTWSVLLAPVALIHLIAFGTFLGLLLAPIGALYQDVSMGLTLITGLWLFITPVVYPIPQTGPFAEIVKLNPVTPLLVTVRELATTGIISNPTGFWVCSAIALFGLLFAWVVYRLALPFVVERISS